MGWLNKGWVMVYAEPNHASIMEAFRKGNFYASTGVDGEFTRTGNRLMVKTDVNVDVFWHKAWGTIVKRDYNVTESYYDVQGNENYVRASIREHVRQDRKAWFQPYFVRPREGLPETPLNP